MSYSPTFQGWNALTIEDLLVAYRKAKADCFYENAFPTAIKFAEYEQELLQNLGTLLELLQTGKFHTKAELLGDCRLVPKKLGISAKQGSNKGHAHFSDPERSFEVLKTNCDLMPEFRVVGDFPVDTHVISALWINMIGHKFDACLGDSCYGSRLRRIRNEDNLDKNAQKPFHITAYTSFEPYFQPYKRWRQDGLDAIRDELSKGRKTVAVSMDLKSYYHQIDPKFFGTAAFQKTIGLDIESPQSKIEMQFTKQLANFLNRWSNKASTFASELHGQANLEIAGGLVIGLTATRIISNSLLVAWDELVQEKVTPIHYGRYIDDMFLVMHDPGTIDGMSDLMAFLQGRLSEEVLAESADIEGLWAIDLGKSVQKTSQIQLQARKQKLFVLEGQGGEDLLDSIEKEIVELSSERRLMPSPDQLENSMAARVLSAAGHVGEHADTLRRADGLTIRRLGWSMHLRHVETLAKDLPPSAWKKQRKEFYSFAHQHVLRPERIFDHYSYLPRLLGFAIGLNEWSEADAIVRHSFNALSRLEETCNAGRAAINGSECGASKDLWRYVKGSLAWSFIDAAAKNYPANLLFSDNPSKKVKELARVFMDQLWQELTSLNDLLDFDLTSGNFDEKAPLLASADLARTPYKTMIASDETQSLLKEFVRKKEVKLLKAFSNAKLLDTDALKDFLGVTAKKRIARQADGKRRKDGYRPYIFPTRPYTPSEVAELDPRCVGIGELNGKSPQDLWAKYVRALRGVWVKPVLLSDDEAAANEMKPRKRERLVRIGTGKKTSVIVAITNISTSDKSWAGSASAKPHLSLARYTSVSNMVNQAIQLSPRPDYLVFPELSLPLQWINSIAAKLIGNGISLIAGTEYRHESTNLIHSEACLELIDDRLGFPSSARIFQPKLEPAVGEDRELSVKYGLQWKGFGRARKPVYEHNDFQFGVMVCSELQNSKSRIGFQGDVDALIVLSWNQDLDTFAALVESAALDIHAYTILVNNRRYGDSRVRSPAKESFRRDIARLRGGENDFCVAVELDIHALRAFQSRAKRWPNETDLFKPVPEGYKISRNRRTKPPH